MLDIKYIRENVDDIAKTIKQKGIDLDIVELIEIDKQRVSLIKEVEELNSLKNDLNSLIRNASTQSEREELIKKGKIFKEKLEIKEPFLKEIEKKFMELMAKVPTVQASDVPIGKDDSENVVVYEWGKKPSFSFKPKSHVELAEELDIIDFKRGVKVSGFRGYYLKNEGVDLVMALMNYAMHKIASKGFRGMIPPTIVKEKVLFGSGYFSGTTYNGEVDEVYQVITSDKDLEGDKERKFLVGTAEPSLLAYYSNEVISESELPIKIYGFSQCYRSEIGSHGKDTTGLYRVHEFMKVEQIVLTKADKDEAIKAQEEMIAISEEIHKELGLPYRKLAICTGDLSAGKYRQFDMEVWMPGLGRWGETGSASIFLDWQSRRLNVKYKNKDGKKKYVYMLNNTVLPSPRPLIAILENYQQEDGSVVVPEVLIPFMINKAKVIRPKK